MDENVTTTQTQKQAQQQDTAAKTCGALSLRFALATLNYFSPVSQIPLFSDYLSGVAEQDRKTHFEFIRACQLQRKKQNSAYFPDGMDTDLCLRAADSYSRMAEKAGLTETFTQYVRDAMQDPDTLSHITKTAPDFAKVIQAKMRSCTGAPI